MAILYNPDIEEENIPMKSIQKIMPTISNTHVLKIGRSKIPREEKSSLRIEFYTQEVGTLIE